ncbi:hypothetical protein O6H91_05G110200 [Diphasiastrum complanatum]|uniref:Uncharacterized protein n=1 Tax=Diphasiastrum complanatum TaxID=34168 RepID=A0ACC2DRZ8_DIPCM|nr:hypothetical protein O6H91_05G110200 [Diphasiastrum complanatum]
MVMMMFDKAHFPSLANHFIHIYILRCQSSSRSHKKAAPIQSLALRDFLFYMSQLNLTHHYLLKSRAFMCKVDSLSLYAIKLFLAHAPKTILTFTYKFLICKFQFPISNIT